MRSWWRGRKGLGDPLLHSTSEWVPVRAGWWQPQPFVFTAGAWARERSWLYLPIEGLVGLADLHPLLVASGCDEVEDGLLVTACGESQESLQPPCCPQSCSGAGAGRTSRAKLAPGRKGKQESFSTLLKQSVS